MNYKIKTLPDFKVITMIREFDLATSKSAIPEFWQEYFRRGFGETACGQFGICFDCNENGTFHYGIANRCDVEIKHDGSTIYHIFARPDLTRIPDGFELRTIPAQTWMIIEAQGALPHSIQDTYPKIEQEWPNGFEHIYGMDIEEYGYCKVPEDSLKDDYLCWIWVPVKPKND